MRRVLLLMVLGMLFLPLAVAEDYTVKVHSFYGNGCPHCAKLHAFLEEMQDKYAPLDVEEYEVYFDQENRALFQELSKEFNKEVGGVPTVFIDQKVIVGFSDTIADQLESEIQRCLETDCGDPLELAKTEETTKIIGDKSPSESPEQAQLKKSLTLPAVLSAAAVDAINPCAFAVLIILLTTILASDKRRQALWSGLAFTASIFISYFLMGVGLYSAIVATGISRVFYTVVAVVAILVGLFNLKDYFAYGKWFVMEVPMSWRPKLKAVLRGVTSVPGAFLIGFVISLFLLPCTSGPYIVILGLLAHAATKAYALCLLLVYNLIFVVPMLAITFAIYFGLTTTEKAEAWRKSKLKILHLIAGIIILLLGIGMFIAMHLGML